MRSTQRYYRRPYGGQPKQHQQSFHCVHCGLEISCNPIVSGVQNRNHCPCCLWSRHLDWHVAGDRRSPCRAAMQPIGLTTKRSRHKYGEEHDGELMIIHQCNRCEALAINRIAADDSDTELFALLEQSSSIPALLKTNLGSADIVLLTLNDRRMVRRRLLGANPA